MAPYGNISAELSEPDKQFIKDKVEEILTKLDFVINLTPEERQSLPKMGNNRYAFVKKAIQLANENPDVFPGYFNLDEEKKDFDLFDALIEVGIPVRQLFEKMEDTRMAVGSEAYKTALQIKGLFEEANKTNPGLDTVVEELAEFFKHTSQDDEPEPQPEPPAVELTTKDPEDDVELGINGVGDYEVDWDDGEKETITLDDSTQFLNHTYSQPGEYVIKLKGKLSTLTEVHSNSSALIMFLLPIIASGVMELILQNNNLSSDVVNQLLITMDSFGTSGGVINLIGNASPTGDGLTAKANLEARGWVVLVS